MTASMAHVLIVDAEADAGRTLAEVLGREGHTARHVTAANQALQALEADLYDLVIAELWLGEEPGVWLLGQTAERWPELPVVMAAAQSTLAEAVAALRSGAVDFLVKPYTEEETRYVVNKALTGAAVRAAAPPLPRNQHRRSKLLGESAEMKQVRELVRRAASGNATVLIRGESGTGKELVARAVHEASARRGKPFVKIDCTSLPDALLESELFGYERGAFTGAVARKPGRVELAEGGTLFLDEIGELSPVMQAKLLRLLQDREFEKLGGKQTLTIDARFILATHRDLETMVANGTFRQDLFYRLNVVPLWLPPLRARRADIELLVQEFCARFAAENGKSQLALAPSALKYMRSQRWPGNVRQLENLVERLVVLNDGPVIELPDVEREFAQKPRFVTQRSSTTHSVVSNVVERPTETASISTDPPQPLSEAVRNAEKQALLAALKRSGGNRSVAARVLGVSRATLYNKLKELGIEGSE
jgi:two-component system, NtrC family, response regulator AtoC